MTVEEDTFPSKSGDGFSYGLIDRSIALAAVSVSDIERDNSDNRVDTTLA
jgi:hypothetical protein